MKKIIAIASFLFLSFGTASIASAYSGYNSYNPYICTGVYPNYCLGAIPSSYYYTSGCYTYYYNGYTRTSSVVSYNCQTNYTYVAPTTQYYYTSPYYTYSYINGSWYPSYAHGNYNYGNYNYNNGFVYTPGTGCYYTASGYYACQ